MRNWLLMGALSVTGAALSLTGCTNPSGLDSIAVSPSTQSLAVGQTAQLGVTGTYGNASHASTQPVTSGVTWSSNSASVATVSASGLVTAIAAGTATITASAQGFNGPLSSTSTITVGSTSGSGGSTGGSVVSVAVIPSAQTVSSANQTTQFVAIGTTSTGATVYLTNSVTWSSSSPLVATIGATTGLATSVGAGTATITALYTNTTTGIVATGIATLTVAAGASEQVTSLSLLPSSLSLTASGQTSQLILLGVAGSTGLTENFTPDTKDVVWSSSTPTVAEVGPVATDKNGNPLPPGEVIGVNAGTTTIVAQYTNSDGSIITASVPVSVTISGTGTSLESITSLSIIPSSITVDDFQLSGQFLAIGTFSQAPYVRDVTNDPQTAWLSSFPNSFPVSTNCQGSALGGATCAGNGASAGIVTAYASGGAQIIAEATAADGTIQSATATFNCPEVLPPPAGSTSQTPGSCYPGEPLGSQLISTLTVYNRGLNTTTWQVTAPSATGTADVLHCGPGWAGAGGSVCTASYPNMIAGADTTVILTSPAGAGNFGGWSSNCVPSDASGTPLTGAAAAGTAAGPNYCVVDLVTDDTVGIIVN